MLGILVLVLLVGGLGLCRWTPLRRLAPQQRIQAMAGLTLLSLILLRLAAPAYNQAILAGTRGDIHIDLAITIATLATAVAVGLAAGAVWDDMGRRATRILGLALFLVPLLISLCSTGWAPILAIPLAIRTGWARQLAEERRRVATLLSVVGVAAILAWPVIFDAPGPCWSPAGVAGTSLIHFGRTFLFGQLGVLALRFLLGLLFGPHRIGRRLLVSHMLAGLVPVALTGLFAILISLLALANLRASMATDLLRLQHRSAERMLNRVTNDVVAEMAAEAGGTPQRWSRSRLSQLARRVGQRWPGIHSWTGQDPPPAAAPSPCTAASARTGDEDFSVIDGDSLLLTLLPPRAAWLGRPHRDDACGLIQHGGNSFHVTDCRLTASRGGLRVQIIERLADGRVPILDRRLNGLARIDERYTLTYDFHLVGTSAVDSSDADTAVRAASPLNSGYELVIGQAWSSNTEDGDPAGAWRRIRIPILGISRFGDLTPPVPDNLMEAVPLLVFIFTALLFVAVEAFAFFSALRMGRTIAQSVNRLREGTDRLRRGDLSFRISISGQDELASLGSAFNEMAMGLEEGRRIALEKERLESEMALARRIQQRLLPGRPPEIAGLQLAGVSVPARHVGGDYYDFLPLPNDRLLVVMADVSGKGAPAAILMSSLRASLHNLLPGEMDLPEIARRLNCFVHASTDITEFITFFFGIIEAPSGRLTYINAGHEHPYLLRRNHQVERLATGGLMLGAYPEVPYEEDTVQLQSGDLLFLFTDGLTEAHNSEGRMFGEEPLDEMLPAVATLDPDSILRASLERVDRFVDGAERSDDITLLAIRRVSPV